MGDEDIMQALMADYQRCNLVEVDLAGYQANYVHHRISVIIDGAVDVSYQNFKGSFSGINFLHKLVDQKTIRQKFSLRSDDFFQGALYVDYLCNILLGDYRFIEENNFRGKGLMDLVQDSASYFTELRRTTYYDNHNNCLDKYFRFRPINFKSKLAAEILLDLTTVEAVKDLYEKAEGVMDLKAAFFIDCVMGALGQQEIPENVQDAVDSDHFYDASVLAYSNLYATRAEQVRRELLKDHQILWRGGQINAGREDRTRDVQIAVPRY